MKTISASFTGIEQEELESQLAIKFKEIGFGVLNQIDFRETLINKLDKDIGPYMLLQICNPQLAYEAIAMEPTIGIQLPCNVLIRKTASGFDVDVQSPLDSIPQNAPEALKQTAEELSHKIEALLEKLKE